MAFEFQIGQNLLRYTYTYLIRSRTSNCAPTSTAPQLPPIDDDNLVCDGRTRGIIKEPVKQEKDKRTLSLISLPEELFIHVEGGQFFCISWKSI